MCATHLRTVKKRQGMQKINIRGLQWIGFHNHSFDSPITLVQRVALPHLNTLCKKTPPTSPLLSTPVLSLLKGSLTEGGGDQATKEPPTPKLPLDPNLPTMQNQNREAMERERDVACHTGDRNRGWTTIQVEDGASPTPSSEEMGGCSAAT